MIDLIVLLEEHMHVLKEADRGGTVDDDLHVSAQPRQVSGAQPAVLSVHIAFHNSKAAQCGAQRLFAACIALKERLGLQERV